MTPSFNRDGNLPEGIHKATYDEVKVRYGHNEHRKKLLDKMDLLLEKLLHAGCKQFFLDGSFISNKELPNDYDALLGYEGLNVNLLDPIILQTPNAGLVKEKYSCDLIPCDVGGYSGDFWIDRFTIDKETGNRKGIIKISFTGGSK